MLDDVNDNYIVGVFLANLLSRWVSFSQWIETYCQDESVVQDV